MSGLLAQADRLELARVSTIAFCRFDGMLPRITDFEPGDCLVKASNDSSATHNEFNGPSVPRAVKLCAIL